jgi:hypothetical protein
MIQTQIEGVVYYYGIDDATLCEKYTGVKLWNCFDYEDLSKVHLFDGNTYLGTFDQLTPAQPYGPDKDMRAVGRMKKIAESNKTHKVDTLQQIKQVAMPVNDKFDSDISSELGALLTGRIDKKTYETSQTGFIREDLEIDSVEIDINAERKKY